MPDIKVVSLYDVLPDSLREDPEVKAMAQALDVEVKKVTMQCEKPSIYYNLNRQPSQVLDHLAWQWNADTWRDSWPIALKQSVINSIIPGKRIKGTKPAIIDAISSLGNAGHVMPWYQMDPPGKPYTFLVLANLNTFDDDIPTIQAQEDLIRRIDGVKSTRDKYTLAIGISGSGGLGLAGGSRTIAYARISGVEK